MIATVILSACGTPAGHSVVVEPVGLDAGPRTGRAVQGVAFAAVDDGALLIDGMAGDPSTLEVTLWDGSTFSLSEELPLVGIQSWRWEDSLIIAGTNCSGFDPASVVGTSLEDCGGSDGSVISFDLKTHELEVLVRDAPSEWAHGPLLEDVLLLDGGRTELDLASGEVMPGERYPSTGAIPCATDTGLVTAGVDAGEVRPPGTPVVWKVEVSWRTGARSGWSAVPPGSLPAQLHSALTAGVAGCVREGPVLWAYDGEQVSTSLLKVVAGVLAVVAFAEPIAVDVPPTVQVDASGRWVAVTSLLPSDAARQPGSVVLSDGGAWSPFEWDGRPLTPPRFIRSSASKLRYVAPTERGGWTLKTGQLR